MITTALSMALVTTKTVIRMIWVVSVRRATAEVTVNVCYKH